MASEIKYQDAKNKTEKLGKDMGLTKDRSFSPYQVPNYVESFYTGAILTLWPEGSNVLSPVPTERFGDEPGVPPPVNILLSAPYFRNISVV